MPSADSSRDPARSPSSTCSWTSPRTRSRSRRRNEGAAMNDLTARVRASLWWLLPLLALVLLIGGEIDWGRALHIAPPPAEPIAPKPVVAGLLPEYTIAGGLGAHAETVN